MSKDGHTKPILDSSNLFQYLRSAHSRVSHDFFKVKSQNQYFILAFPDQFQKLHWSVPEVLSFSGIFLILQWILQYGLRRIFLFLLSGSLCRSHGALYAVYHVVSLLHLFWENLIDTNPGTASVIATCRCSPLLHRPSSVWSRSPACLWCPHIMDVNSSSERLSPALLCFS